MYYLGYILMIASLIALLSSLIASGRTWSRPIMKGAAVVFVLGGAALLTHYLTGS
ncbi:hypothetical protein Sked_01110 [Sanguibacter keddieii DSM 10542]|uniref:Uncharacterized protein n=1 Tax=Sanguibacter keddieii (strain ATCC 51767 / DSM 10542 / NCFB 3025 / ST-74) TaxID=446469 RepID=D1BIP1_SANKS|nr:hypothetical protein Sked_01110 [Sanguibacter keddieii DSM 10542]